MNERIKKLAEQAGFSMWADEPWNPGDVIDWNARYDNELEKFAALIVKECLKSAVEAQADYYVINSINSKFGIKE